jgi:DNA polymerase III delta prime subunit
MLVGREKELTKVVENMRRGIHTLVFGPAGTGKSALLQEAARQLDRGDMESLRAVYVGDCGGCRRLLAEALATRPLQNRSARGKPLHSTSRVDGRLRVRDLRDQLLSSAQESRLCLLLDHLPPLHHRMRRLLELLEEKFTLACAVTAHRGAYHLHYYRFDKVELVDLRPDLALGWVEDELGRLGYGEALRVALAREITRRAGNNPGLIAETLKVIRAQPQRLDDPIRVRRMFVDGMLNRLGRSAGLRKEDC